MTEMGDIEGDMIGMVHESGTIKSVVGIVAQHKVYVLLLQLCTPKGIFV